MNSGCNRCSNPPNRPECASLSTPTLSAFPCMCQGCVTRNGPPGAPRRTGDPQPQPRRCAPNASEPSPDRSSHAQKKSTAISHQSHARSPRQSTCRHHRPASPPCYIPLTATGREHQRAAPPLTRTDTRASPRTRPSQNRARPARANPRDLHTHQQPPPAGPVGRPLADTRTHEGANDRAAKPRRRRGADARGTSAREGESEAEANARSETGAPPREATPPDGTPRGFRLGDGGDDAALAAGSRAQ